MNTPFKISLCGHCLMAGTKFCLGRLFRIKIKTHEQKSEACFGFFVTSFLITIFREYYVNIL